MPILKTIMYLIVHRISENNFIEKFSTNYSADDYVSISGVLSTSIVQFFCEISLILKIFFLKLFYRKLHINSYSSENYRFTFSNSRCRHYCFSRCKRLCASNFSISDAFYEVSVRCVGRYVCYYPF